MTAFAIYLAIGAVWAADAMCRSEREHAPARVTVPYFVCCIIAGLFTALLWLPWTIFCLFGDRRK